jgi:hypothetical protein
MSDGERVAELKAELDRCKAEVRAAQEALSGLRGRAEAGGRGGWPEYRAARKRWEDALRARSEAQLALVRVTGTTGSDPRWTLIRDAWRILNRLQDAGVDIGEDGEKLMNDIEFQVPASKLVELKEGGT